MSLGFAYRSVLGTGLGVSLLLCLLPSNRFLHKRITAVIVFIYTVEVMGSQAVPPLEGTMSYCSREMHSESVASFSGSRHLTRWKGFRFFIFSLPVIVSVFQSVQGTV